MTYSSSLTACMVIYIEHLCTANFVVFLDTGKLTEGLDTIKEGAGTNDNDCFAYTRTFTRMESVGQYIKK